MRWLYLQGGLNSVMSFFFFFFLSECVWGTCVQGVSLAMSEVSMCIVQGTHGVMLSECLRVIWDENIARESWTQHFFSFCSYFVCLFFLFVVCGVFVFRVSIQEGLNTVCVLLSMSIRYMCSCVWRVNWRFEIRTNYLSKTICSFLLFSALICKGPKYV